MRNLISAVKNLTSLDVEDPRVASAVEALASTVNPSYGVDLDFIQSQVSRLHSAAVIPAKNYERMRNITAGLHQVVQMAKSPENEALRPRIAKIVERVAGAFALIDTVQDLDRPLSEIEAAVHRLYSNGKQNAPSTYNFEARHKGGHGVDK